MEIKSLRCNHCGINLKVNPKILFFTCSNCGSSLTVKSSGNILYTEVIKNTEDNANILVDNSKRLLKEQEIERLDREWLLKREQFKLNSSEGEERYPEKAANMSNFIGGIIFLLFIIIIGPLIYANHQNQSKASKYKVEKLIIEGKEVSRDHPLVDQLDLPKRKDQNKSFLKILVFIYFLIIILVISQIYSFNNKAINYAKAKEKYLNTRDKLLKELKN